MKSTDKNIKKLPLNSDYNAAKEKENNIIGERIAKARTEHGLTLAAFRKRLSEYGVEVGPAAINKWEMGKVVPNAYQLLAVAHALNLEEDMLYFVSQSAALNSEGMKKLGEYKNDLILSGRYKPVQAVPQIEYITMPVSYLKVSAGTGAFLDEGQFEEMRFPANAVPNDADFGLYISGDSMEPVYHDGQIVWVKKCKSLFPGEVGIFVYDGNGYIKCYNEQTPSGVSADDYTDSYGFVHRQPVLISYNENYPPIEISPSVEFQIVGRVVRS